MSDLEFPGGSVKMPAYAEPVPGMREPAIHCPYCGEPCDGTVTVEYDAMVDGPGCVESEERCDACIGRR